MKSTDDGRTDESTDQRIDGRTDGQTDGRTDGLSKPLFELFFAAKKYISDKVWKEFFCLYKLVQTASF